MSSKCVILEGPDGGGKSTIANWLHKEYNYEIVKTGPPALNVNIATAYLDALHAALNRPGRTVFDRLHLGEAIYGPLLRGIDRIGADGLAAIEQRIAVSDVVMIICSPPWDILVSGWRSKDDLLKDEQTLAKVHSAYLRHAVRLGLNVYDWTATGAEETLKGLIKA